jgi:aminoglycoside phosphotransferase family enzyme/predicted kinase
MPPDLDALTQARTRIESLRAWLQSRDGAAVRLVETHISWVLLTSTLAYKLKKPLRLPFLDFSTLALRRHFCSEELRLNQRLAPSLYLDLVEVCDGAEGLRFGGGGTVVDVAVRMRRFPDGALWSEMTAAGSLAAHHVDALAQRLADFHQAAAVALPGSAFGSAASHEHVLQGLIDANDAERREGATAATDAHWPALRAWLIHQSELLAPLWAARLRDGRVRECHGDLHLANVLQLAGRPAAFDGIEFDPELRWIDVLDDISFVAMDLLANDRHALAFRFINAYLQAGGDYAGLPALRYYMACRALVRARVVAIGERQGVNAAAPCSAARYMALASSLSTGADARLAITHGLPGSGKSFVSQGVLEQAGAICARSDVERKRLFGLGALEKSQGRVAGGIYDSATTKRTYSRLAEIAAATLAAGWPALIDAAFLRRSERAEFAGLAESLGVPFTVLDCHAESSVLHRRLEQRQATGADPSEADAAVLDRLAEADEPLDDSERAAAMVVGAAEAASPAPLARRWRAAVR